MRFRGASFLLLLWACTGEDVDPATSTKTGNLGEPCATGDRCLGSLVCNAGKCAVPVNEPTDAGATTPPEPDATTPTTPVTCAVPVKVSKTPTIVTQVSEDVDPLSWTTPDNVKKGGDNQFATIATGGKKHMWLVTTGYALGITGTPQRVSVSFVGGAVGATIKVDVELTDGAGRFRAPRSPAARTVNPGLSESTYTFNLPSLTAAEANNLGVALTIHDNDLPSADFNLDLVALTVEHCP